MSIERALRLIAGCFILITVLLTYLHSQWWLAATAFIGVNLAQSGLTDWCPMVWILRRLGLKHIQCPVAAGPQAADQPGTGAR